MKELWNVEVYGKYGAIEDENGRIWKITETPDGSYNTETGFYGTVVEVDKNGELLLDLDGNERTGMILWDIKKGISFDADKFMHVTKDGDLVEEFEDLCDWDVFTLDVDGYNGRSFVQIRGHVVNSEDEEKCTWVAFPVSSHEKSEALESIGLDSDSENYIFEEYEEIYSDCLTCKRDIVSSQSLKIEDVNEIVERLNALTKQQQQKVLDKWNADFYQNDIIDVITEIEG